MNIDPDNRLYIDQVEQKALALRRAINSKGGNAVAELLIRAAVAHAAENIMHQTGQNNDRKSAMDSR